MNCFSLQRFAPVMLLLALAPLHAAAPPPPQDALLQATQEGLQRVPLPLAVLRASGSATLADLRFTNAHGDTLPWALLPTPQAEHQRTQPLPVFDWPAVPAAAHTPNLRIELGSDGAVLRVPTPYRAGAAARVWLLDASQHDEAERLHALRLDGPTPRGGYSGRARVEGSADLRRWIPLADEPVLDLPAASGGGGEGVIQRRVPLPATPLKYLRLTLQPPLTLRQVQADWRSANTAVLDSADIAVPADGGAGRGTWSWSLGPAVPLRQLQVRLAQPNTVLPLQLERREAEGRNASWILSATFTAYRFQRAGDAPLSPPVELPDLRAPLWRLRATAAAPSTDLAELPLRLQWPAQAAVLVARGPGPYRVSVGGDPPRSGGPLALSDLLPKGQHAEALPTATVGVLQARAPDTRTWYQRLLDTSPEGRKRWLLWGVLVAAVAGLALLARRLMKDLAKGAEAGP